MIWVIWTAEWSLGTVPTQDGALLTLPAPDRPLYSSQLQKAADPWVLKHSDLEKQDNSWKEVSGMAGHPYCVLLATLESSSLVGNVTRRILTLSHRSQPYLLGLLNPSVSILWF